MDTDTFVTILYIVVDDYCKVSLKPDVKRGPKASLSRSEVITLAVFGQWYMFFSERGFYRYAKKHLIGAFPTLPHRTQLNRLIRRYHDAIEEFSLALADMLGAKGATHEAMDTSAAVTRDLNRRGAGWLPQEADVGWNNHLNTWYEGFHIIATATPEGIVTGYGFGPASAKDQPLADTFLLLRRYPDERIRSVGSSASGTYVTDKGFEGADWHFIWLRGYLADVITPPRKNSSHPWPKELRRWLASIRQIIETVFDKLHRVLRLDLERPHDIIGFRARLAAKMALHNFCIYANRMLGRPSLAFIDLVSW